MAIVKSKLLKQLSKSYPNFLKKDLAKFTDIILNEIRRALRRGDGVELRNFGTFRVKTQKASIRRNPKTGEKVAVPEKKVISWKMSKEMFKKINNEKLAKMLGKSSSHISNTLRLLESLNKKYKIL